MSIGKILFYILWPAIWIYVPFKTRVRVFLVVEEEVLMVKNWLGPHSWQLPGGGMELSETPVQTAKREISEELSIDLKEENIKLLTPRPIHVWWQGLYMRYQYVEIKLDKKPNIIANKEIVDYSWQAISSVKSAKMLY